MSRERCEDDEPPVFEDEGAYHDDPVELAEIIAEARQASADQIAAEAHIAASGQTAALAAGASAAMGRRGPGMPGSAEPLAGEYSGPGGAFATGQALDVARVGRYCSVTPIGPPVTMTGSTASATTSCSGSSAPPTAARPQRRR